MTGSPMIDVGLPDGALVQLRTACTVIAGGNGTGKTRVLGAAAATLGNSALLLELHAVAHQVLEVTRSRDDFDEMTNEFSPVGPDSDQLEMLSRILGREYANAGWFSLELDLDEPFSNEDFLWGGEEPLVPYFRAQHRGPEYGSLDMGHGEFASHLLFWILDQYKEQRNVVLLLDEPDAFLPPVAATRLLVRLMKICTQRRWRLIVTTHSDDVIRAASSRGALVVLSTDADGKVVAEYSDDDPDVAEHLLARSPIENVIFCEDESALHLAAAVLQATNHALFRSTSLQWGNGHGGLRELQTHLPRTPKPDLRFALAFDGDQRGSVTDSPDAWPAIFLPTGEDPDTLFKSLKDMPDKLAAEMSVSEHGLRRFLTSLEGEEAHDWVNKLGREYGRQIALTALARLWVREHAEEAAAFVEELQAGWS